MMVSEISLYNALKTKLGEQDAQTIIEGIRQEVKSEFDNKKDLLATKEDIAKLDVKMSETKAEIIKWMFIFWVGQMASTVALVKLLH